MPPPSDQIAVSQATPAGQMVDRSGRIWIATPQHSYFAASGRNCSIASLRPVEPAGLTISRTLCVDANGVLQVSTPLRAEPGDPMPQFAAASGAGGAPAWSGGPTTEADGTAPSLSPCAPGLQRSSRDGASHWPQEGSTGSCR